MAKKTHGGGGGGQQQKPAEEGEEQAPGAPNSGDAPAAEGNKDREHEKGNDKEKDQEEKGAKGKDKDGKKPPPPPMVTAVLKLDMHCDGCAKRIRGSVHRYPGVEGVAMEVDKGSMTVVGRFDAKKLRDRVADKTRKTVDLVVGSSSNNKGGGAGAGGNQQKGANDEDRKQAGKRGEQEGKDKTDRLDKEGKGNGKDDGSGSGGGGGGGKGKGGSGKDNKRPVVPVVATVVLKIGSTGLHCDGCMSRIHSKLFKIKGVEQVRMDHGQEPGDGDGDHGRQGPAGEAAQDAAAPRGRGGAGQGQGRERRGDQGADGGAGGVEGRLLRPAVADQRRVHAQRREPQRLRLHVIVIVM